MNRHPREGGDPCEHFWRSPAAFGRAPSLAAWIPARPMTEVLSDEQWTLLEGRHHPRARSGRGRPIQNMRRSVEGVVWRHQNGAEWRAVPDEFGPWGARGAPSTSGGRHSASGSACSSICETHTSLISPTSCSTAPPSAPTRRRRVEKGGRVECTRPLAGGRLRHEGRAWSATASGARSASGLLPGNRSELKVAEALLAVADEPGAPWCA